MVSYCYKLSIQQCYTYCTTAGEGNRMHYHHDWDEWWYILEGEWEWLVDGEKTNNRG